MWIRTQDKKTLCECHKFVVIGLAVKGVDKYGNYVTLGTYDSEEKCKKVIDTIMFKIEIGKVVFDMPKGKKEEDMVYLITPNGEKIEMNEFFQKEEVLENDNE